MDLQNFGRKNTHIRAYKKIPHGLAAVVQMVTDLAGQQVQNEYDLPELLQGKIKSDQNLDEIFKDPDGQSVQYFLMHNEGNCHKEFNSKQGIKVDLNVVNLEYANLVSKKYS